jgi:hypothetical protein
VIRLRHIATRIPAAILVATVAIALVQQPVEAQLVPSFGRDRAGTSGFQFLKIPVDARGAAMGETVVSNAVDASSMFWNPALLAQASSKTIVGFSNTRYHADVALNYVAAAQQIGSFKVGASVHTMDSGDMEVTTEFQPFGTGESFKVFDISLGLTVAQALTDLFSYGVTARYVEENIASVSHSTLVFDAGVFYRIGNTGAQMAVAIRSFGLDSSSDGEIERVVVGDPGIKIEDSFEQITPPTTFMLGITYEPFQRSLAGNQLLFSGQLNNPNDNAESFNLGVEFVWNNTLSLRGGYRVGVEEADAPSVGVGIVVPGLGPDVRFDYGFNQLERLGSVHRIGLDVQL